MPFEGGSAGAEVRRWAMGLIAGVLSKQDNGALGAGAAGPRGGPTPGKLHSCNAASPSQPEMGRRAVFANAQPPSHTTGELPADRVFPCAVVVRADGAVHNGLSALVF